jgi:tetrahydromethanopterin S-methyltransferase subunit G
LVARIRRRRTERKIEDVNGEDHFVFRIGKKIGNENGKLRLISERTSDIDEEFCAFIVD